MDILNISKTLIEKRKEKGITQEDLAQYIGVSKASVSKWETGQSYPDITFLPQLASYFNITVDELINYNPQMEKEDIKKLYIRLAKDFEDKPFDEVLEEIKQIIKKYYSCFQLLFYMAILLLNHMNLSGDRMSEIVEYIIELFKRIKSQTTDIVLLREATIMEANCYLIVNKPLEVIELLGEDVELMVNPQILLSQAYLMINKMNRAEEVLQIATYQNILTLTSDMINQLNIVKGDIKKSDEITNRILGIVKIFNMEKLHEANMITIYLVIAQVYAEQNRKDNALDMLDKYCNLGTRMKFPLKLKGDDYFDKIEGWISEMGLGSEMPRTTKFVKESIIDAITKNPIFLSLNDSSRFKSIVERLVQI